MNKTLLDFCSFVPKTSDPSPPNSVDFLPGPCSACSPPTKHNLSKPLTKIPKHVAVVLDGNRRYAETIGLPPSAGHFAGALKMFDISEWLFNRGVKDASYYVWAIKNFSRKAEEKQMIFSFMKYIPIYTRDNKTDFIKKHGVEFKISGNLQLLPLDVRAALKQVEIYSRRVIKNNNIRHQHTINLCIAYGFDDELLRACNKALEKHGKLKTIDDIFNELDVSTPVDLFIRPGKEVRDSGFLPIQSAQAEKVYYPKLLPQITEHDIDHILHEYSNRDIRLGGGVGRPLPNIKDEIYKDVRTKMLDMCFVDILKNICSGDVGSLLIDGKLYLDRLFCNTFF